MMTHITEFKLNGKRYRKSLSLTLVKVMVGKVIPIRKPTITPKKDVRRSLIIWPGLLILTKLVYLQVVI